jgi:hypothetical protein
VLGLGAAAVASAAAGVTLGSPSYPASAATTQAAAAEADALRPVIRPRADWAGAELGVKGELIPEDDVRFLLVHHTASTNDYGPNAVVDQIRGFYDFHTGPEKGWPDVAYNFFIDRYGGIWEGRQGSASGPVRGDATGGSQGFALLCSLIGNHAEAEVTPDARQALTQLLAWLGATYAVDTTPGATVTFTSRGSNRWPAGTEVEARTISGHREMSTTSCPGDLAFALLETEVPTAVTDLRAATSAALTTTSSTSTPSTSTTSSTVEQSASVTPSGGDAAGTTSTPAIGSGADGDVAGPDTAQAAPTTGGTPADDDGTSWPLIIAGGVMGVVAAGAGLVSRVLDRRSPSGPAGDGR